MYVFLPLVMNRRKDKITFNLPPEYYAAGEKLAEDDNASLSIWTERQIRIRARERYGIDLDNPSEADRAKLSKWIDDLSVKKKRKPTRKQAKTTGGKKKKT